MRHDLAICPHQYAMWSMFKQMAEQPFIEDRPVNNRVYTRVPIKPCYQFINNEIKPRRGKWRKIRG